MSPQEGQKCPTEGQKWSKIWQGFRHSSPVINFHIADQIYESFLYTLPHIGIMLLVIYTPYSHNIDFHIFILLEAQSAC